jgi:cyclophilin family peptidyl-prolyl cis-trans isomerase
MSSAILVKSSEVVREGLSMDQKSDLDDKPQRRLRNERVVVQLNEGDLVIGFYEDEARETADHILKAFRLGLYDTNHVFRVDKGFVAQIADAKFNRRVKTMSELQRQHAEKKIRGEFQNQEINHRLGTLSMARFDDPNSGTTSFSILLGNAPHLDKQYTQFGELIEGFEVLKKLEQLETKREGIFVMPKERIEILSTYVIGGDENNTVDAECARAKKESREKQLRIDSLLRELHEIRASKLPS